MPWRRFRKKVERPIDVSKSIEESLEDAADGEADEDLVELAELDDATITEAATGQPDEDRAPTELGDKLRSVLEDAAERGGPLRSAPRGIRVSLRSPANMGRPGRSWASRSSSTSPGTASTTTCMSCTR